MFLYTDFQKLRNLCSVSIHKLLITIIKGRRYFIISDLSLKFIYMPNFIIQGRKEDSTNIWYQSWMEQRKLSIFDFCIYLTLLYFRNSFNSSFTSISFILNFINYNSRKENIDKVKYSLGVLKNINLISYDFSSIGKVSNNTLLEIKIIKYDSNFLQLYEHDFRMLQRLSQNEFMIYILFKNYYFEDKGYSNISIGAISNITSLSTKTIQEIINMFQELKLVEISKINHPNSTHKHNVYKLNSEQRDLICSKSINEAQQQIKAAYFILSI